MKTPHNIGAEAGLEHRTLTIGIQIDHDVQHPALAYRYIVTAPNGHTVADLGASHQVAELLAGFRQAKQAKVSRGQTVGQAEQGADR